MTMSDVTFTAWVTVSVAILLAAPLVPTTAASKKFVTSSKAALLPRKMGDALLPHVFTKLSSLTSSIALGGVVFFSLTVAKYEPPASTAGLATSSPLIPTETSVPGGGIGDTLPPTVTVESVVRSFPPELRVIWNAGFLTSSVAGNVASGVPGAPFAVSVYVYVPTLVGTGISGVPTAAAAPESLTVMGPLPGSGLILAEVAWVTP